MSEIIFGFHPRDTLLGKVRRMRRRSSFVPASDRRKELIESPVQPSKDSHSSTAAQTLTIIRFSMDPQLYHKPSALQLCLIPNCFISLGSYLSLGLHYYCCSLLVLSVIF
uniref:Uncharacterized protein n=1 Tax=Heterorhabditis bacteriophora TaxID=37862 RepID=A0A1I7W6J6_HETBA